MHNPATRPGWTLVFIPSAAVWMDIGLQTDVGSPVRSGGGLFP